MKKFTKVLFLCAGLFAAVAHAEDAKPAAAPAAAAPAAQGSFVAKETVCKNGKNVRKVKLSFGDSNTGADCKAVYIKDTEAAGAEKVLWNSPTHGKVCQEHAESFVEKLKGQGWACE